MKYAPLPRGSAQQKARVQQAKEWRSVPFNILARPTAPRQMPRVRARFRPPAARYTTAMPVMMRGAMPAARQRHGGRVKMADIARANATRRTVLQDVAAQHKCQEQRAVLMPRQHAAPCHVAVRRARVTAQKRNGTATHAVIYTTATAQRQTCCAAASRRRRARSARARAAPARCG